MKKFFEWIKQWASVIILSALVAMLMAAFVCCLTCGGKVYPIFGAVGTAAIISACVFNLALEIKDRRNGR
jgi:uncharacterized membrane protein YkvI